MSLTDPRAVALAEQYVDEFLMTEGIAAITEALADAERRGMERAAKIALRKAQEPWKVEAANREGLRIAQAIRAQAQADKEG